jgi:hypothetical protein
MYDSPVNGIFGQESELAAFPSPAFSLLEPLLFSGSLSSLAPEWAPFTPEWAPFAPEWETSGT